MKVLALAAAAALAARAGAEHTVWRPADWGGPFRKDKDITESTKVADSVFGHGIAQPHVLPCGHLGEHKLEGFECYRVYLVLDTNIAETIYAVFGSVYSHFNLYTVDKSDFFQAPAGLDVDVGGVNPALFQFVGASRFDSWFTVGADDGESQNALSTVGFEKFGNVSSIAADNAAVFASDPGIIPSTLKAPEELEGANKQTVLIAQFTVKEGTEFVWQFNVQGMLGDKVSRHTWQEHGICATNVKDSKHCKQFPVEHTSKAYSEKDEL